jgi:hypothetical protein
MFSPDFGNAEKRINLQPVVITGLKPINKRPLGEISFLLFMLLVTERNQKRKRPEHAE